MNIHILDIDNKAFFSGLKNREFNKRISAIEKDMPSTIEKARKKKNSKEDLSFG